MSPDQAVGGSDRGRPGKWGRLGEACAEKDASAGGACMRELEGAALCCGSESVYVELTTINRTCHIPYSLVSVDLWLLSVLDIAGPQEKPDKQNFPSWRAFHN